MIVPATLYSEAEAPLTEVGTVYIPVAPLPQVIILDERAFALGTDGRYWEVPVFHVPPRGAAHNSPSDKFQERTPRDDAASPIGPPDGSNRVERD